MKPALVASVLLFGLPGIVIAAHDPLIGHYRASLFPPSPSVNETSYIVFRDSCGEVTIGDRPRISKLPSGDWLLEVRWQDEGSVCFATPPAFSTTIHAIPIDPAQIDSMGGYAEFTVRLINTLRPPEQQLQGEDDVLLVYPIRQVPRSVAGTWFNPESPGQGLFVSYHEGPANTQLMASWMTFEPSGEPMWLTGAGVVSSYSFIDQGRMIASLQLLRGQAGGFAFAPPAASTSVWGEAEFEHISCGKAALSWNAIDANRYPPGRVELVQLTEATGFPCDLAAYAARYQYSLDIQQPLFLNGGPKAPKQLPPIPTGAQAPD